MSKVNDQAVAIAAIIDAVPDSGIVYSYRPMPRESWSDFISAFTVEIAGQRQVRCWTVQYLGEERRERNVAGTAAKQQHNYRWKARLYLSWKDADEPVFRDLVEAVADAIDEHRTLAGEVVSHYPVDVTIPNNGDGIVLGDVLCHFAELDFQAWDEVNLTLT